MAKNIGKVYLGYEEEIISDKNQTLLNYTVNKIGGRPDWPPLENIQFPSKCPLCGLHRFLIVQCYAPIENSPYHRTLYVFACISPNCWTQSESWLCVRSQIQDNIDTNIDECSTVCMPATDSNLAWCHGADEWDENDNEDAANGNFVNMDNAGANLNNVIQRFSDDEDESNSFEMDTVEQALGNLQVFDAHNANMSPVQGAVGEIGAPTAAAELEEGDEPGLVTVDTPTAPANDLQTLLNQTAELSQDLRSRLLLNPLQFVPKYIYVEEEIKRPNASYADNKVIELLNKYRKENAPEPAAEPPGGAGAEDEVYEEAAPLHGDSMLHAFLMRLRDSPGQILRYSRECPPVLGRPLPAHRPACALCDAPLLCELQLLPALTAALRPPPSAAPPPTHLHYLSVLVLTCAHSCWRSQDTLVVETVLFQPQV